MTLPPRAIEALGALAAVVLSVAAAVAVTWPMVHHLDEVVLGGGELGGWLWRYDWHFRSLEGLQETELGAFETWRAFVGLGRHPETGNILDVLAFSYPLERWFGFPSSYNLKILLLLAGNGVCAYALARYASGSVSAALGACAIAVVNPLTLQEVQASGLRQALLWWVLLYPPLLDRALRRRTVLAGAVAGACFGIAGAFYWFYGLFTGIFTGLWTLWHVWSERARLDSRGLLRAGLGLGLGLLASAGPFVLPYALPAGAGPGRSTSAALPEMSFFLPFPAYDTIAQAPLRPSTYAENLLASINRTIGSSWSASYPFDPSLNEALPLVVVLVGVLPGVLRRRSWAWLVVWLFFYVGTLGPFLRIGDGDNRNVFRVGEYVVRLPFTLMFQFVPGMSRMFAPYRLASFVVVASVALVALGLARSRWRAWLWPFVFVAVVAQPMYRWGKGAVNEGDADSREFRSPIKANRIRVPDYYREIDTQVEGGIVELPLEQQQDLIYYYQLVHRQKVYRSWATPGALPPALVLEGTGGEVGARLRYLALPDEVDGAVPAAWAALSRDPQRADLSALTAEAVATWGVRGKYLRAIVHERGYYLVDPKLGGVLYRSAVERLAAALGVTPVEHVELRKGDPANPVFGVPIVGDLVPWTSQPADLPPERAPARFHMAVLDFPIPDASPLDTEPAPVD